MMELRANGAGQKYYYNLLTNESSWTLPEAGIETKLDPQVGAAVF